MEVRKGHKMRAVDREKPMGKEMGTLPSTLRRRAAKAVAAAKEAAAGPGKGPCSSMLPSSSLSLPCSANNICAEVSATGVV
jgi:hypothetical protein